MEKRKKKRRSERWQTFTHTFREWSAIDTPDAGIQKVTIGLRQSSLHPSLSLSLSLSCIFPSLACTGLLDPKSRSFSLSLFKRANERGTCRRKMESVENGGPVTIEIHFLLCVYRGNG